MIVYLLLGSNRGVSESIFDAALATLPLLGVHVLAVSPYRATVPVAASGRHRFLNAAVKAETGLLPRVLLRRLRGIERDRGRHLHGSRNPPRRLDIDLIFYGHSQIRRRELTVPHPRFASRRFVLQALSDVAPTLRPPGHAHSVQQLLQRLRLTLGV